MSSILRQVILKASDVNKFVKKYNAKTSVTPEEWARSIETSLFPGVLVFSLEHSNSASTGLSLIQKKDSDNTESFYRVKDLSIVVQLDNGKALVVFLTNNAFELRFLEPILIKEARKAILDDKEFNYIIARSTVSLNPDNINALSLLSTNYAQGGSRRGFTSANNPNLTEPGLSLLSFLGFTFPSQSTSGLIKQVLDLGLVLQIICGLDTKMDDKLESNNYYAILTDNGINDLSTDNQSATPTIFSESRKVQESQTTQFANLQTNNEVNNLASNSPENKFSGSIDNSVNIGFEHPASSSGGSKPKFPDDFLEIQEVAKPGFEHPASSSGGSKPKFPDDFLEIQEVAKPGFEHPASSSGGSKPKFPDDFLEIQEVAKPGFEHPASSSGGSKPKFPDDFLEIQEVAKPGFEHPASSSGGSKPKFPDDFLEIQEVAKIGFEHPASSSGGSKPKFPDDFLEIQEVAKPGFEHPASSGDGSKPKFPDDSSAIKPVSISQTTQAGTTQGSLEFGAPGLNPVSEAVTVNSNSLNNFSLNVPVNEEIAQNSIDFQTPIANNANMLVDSTETSNSNPITENTDDLLTLVFDTDDESNESLTNEQNIIASANLSDSNLNKSEMSTLQNESANIISSNSLFGKMASRLSDPKIRNNVTDAPNFNSEIANSETNQRSLSQDKPVYDFNISSNPEIANDMDNSETSQMPLSQDKLVYDFNISSNPEIANDMDNSETSQMPLSQDKLVYDFNISSNPEITNDIANSETSQMPLSQDKPVYDFNISSNPEMANDIANSETSQMPLSQDKPVYDFNISSNPEITNDIANSETSQMPLSQDKPVSDFNTSNNTEIANPEIIDETLPNVFSNLPQTGSTESASSLAVNNTEVTDIIATTNLLQRSESYPPKTIETESSAATTNSTTDSPAVHYMRMPKVSSSTKTTGTKLKAIMQDSNTDNDTEIYNIETSSLLNNEKLIENEYTDNDQKNSESSLISDKVSLADVLEEIVEETLPPAVNQAPVHQTSNFKAVESTNIIPEARPESVTESTAKIKTVQDPKLMMIEVASFVNKLEEQVAKASLKLKVKLDETKLRLGHQAELLYADLTNQASTIENSITDLCIDLGTKLERNYQDANVKLADYIANQRYDIKHKSQNFDEDLQNLLDDAKSQIGKEFKDMLDEFNQFLELHNNSFKDFVESNKSTLSGSINLIETELSSIESEYIGKLNQRLNRFQERISQEVESVIKSLERNVMSMSEEVSGSWFRASEQLNLNKADFEHTVNHYIKTSETTVVLIKQQILLEKILPALARFRDTTKESCEMKLQEFNDLLISIETSQIIKFNDEINNYLNSFKENLNLFEQKLEVYTQTQQNGYESIFNDIALDLEQTTLDLLAQIEEAHKNINSNDELCKNLSKVNIAKEDPQLQQEKLSMSAKIDLLKKDSNKKLNTLVNKKCEDLDMLASQMQAKLSDSRNNSTQEIKEASEEGIQKIRQALQQTFKEIQVARDKCYSD